MINVLIIGMVLAAAGFIVYITRSWTSAQKEKAASDGESKAALDQLRRINETKLEQERKIRQDEKIQVENARPGPGGGTPFGMLPDKDPDSLN